MPDPAIDVLTGVETVALAALFALLAVARARCVGDRLGESTRERCVAAALAVATAVLTAYYAPDQAWCAVGAAFLVVCAWTDWVGRKVYLPVSLAGLGLAAIARATGGAPALLAGVAGGAVLAAISLTLALATRGRGWGGGDTFAFAVVGLAFGLHDGLAIVAAAFIAGALLSVTALALRLIARTTPLPMASFTYVGFLIVVPRFAEAVAAR